MNFDLITSRFPLDGTVCSCEKYGNGHINDTYLVVCETGHRYILQRINTTIFKDTAMLMGNIAAVTGFLGKKTGNPRETLTLVPTKEGENYLADESGAWRVYEFVEDTVCLERPESEEDFYQCAVAFGHFQKLLADFPAEQLGETIPDFHHTPKRYEAFLKAVEEDVCGRADGVREEIEFIKARADFYSVLLDAHARGELPLRVSHNDTKCNNVLLNAVDRTGLCVIDLDTVMPGFSVTDFGDSIRFGASTGAEDEKDLSKVNFHMGLYKAYVKGFLEGCGGSLPESEMMLLPEGAKMMTIECGMRFLADYLQGDVYFKTAYPEHNLVRFRTQRKLVEGMEASWEEMKQAVRELL
ncbi:MAG: aminoglycoside phosphotransferase family protein [Clostridia bacterium]|nr:aminoglycoside phosphotransferase family protein [Clostridia bacterium]